MLGSGESIDPAVQHLLQSIYLVFKTRMCCDSIHVWGLYRNYNFNVTYCVLIAFLRCGSSLIFILKLVFSKHR